MAVLLSVIIAPLLLYADLQDKYLLDQRKETMMSIQTSIDTQHLYFSMFFEYSNLC